MNSWDVFTNLCPKIIPWFFSVWAVEKEIITNIIVSKIHRFRIGDWWNYLMNSLKIDSLEPRICETAIYKKFFSSFQIWPNRMAMKNFIFVVAFLLQVEKGQFEGYSNKGRCNQNLYLNKQFILFSKNLPKFCRLAIIPYQKILWNTSFLGKGLLDFVYVSEHKTPQLILP